MEESSSAEFEALSEQLAKVQNTQLTIAESDMALSALEARVFLARQKGTRTPLSFAQFQAYCLGWVSKCTTATEKVRFETQSLERQIEIRRDLINQKRQYVGNDTLRLHVESFGLEQLVAGRELHEAHRVYYELRYLDAEVKRSMLLDKHSLYDTTQRHARACRDVERLNVQLDDVRAKIALTDSEVMSLEQENQRLRAQLRQDPPPSVQEMVNCAKELDNLKEELFRTVKRCVRLLTSEKTPFDIAPYARIIIAKDHQYYVYRFLSV
ncbi:uncharacterized protein LOC128725758 [Anopheles nili]|uniref:uncharacterized protein LOC128725758 n=1 Tax=Anopheles nili TaxID=185578 RepID=UPI00237B988D|nr:uncharacterized protein LOC128725758 [Anopheles nili]